MTATFYTETAAGCFSGPFPSIVSTHRTWAAAKRAALKSDRLVAVNEETGERFQIPQQNDPRLGHGRYGNGITPTKAHALGLRVE